MARPTWRARVNGGRLTLDVEVNLPDGEVDVALLGPQDVGCDYLLFVVTESEHAQMKAATQARGLPFETKQGPFGEYYDLGQVGISRLYVVQIDEGPFRHRGSAAQAIRWMDWCGARGIIAVGMAFGIDRERQRHRDVLVSTHLLPYDQRTVTSKNEIPLSEYPKVAALPAGRGLLAILDREIDRRNDDDRGFRVHRGALLSGGAKIHSRTFRAHLVSALTSRGKPIVGGEMEGAGLLGAADPAAWLVVKGIIDFADDARNEEFKEHRDGACANAAGLVLDAFLHQPQPGPQPQPEPRPQPAENPVEQRQ
jgi:adenosylhomocysteine nucleosidase